jgi:sec-independent protein translocase protein TatA
MAGLKGYEILIIAAVILLLFGAKKLPDMARSLGKSARILKSEAKQMKKENPKDKAAAEEPVQSETPATPAKTIQAAPGDVTEGRPVDDRVER